jgi:hypothetical protein
MGKRVDVSATGVQSIGVTRRAVTHIWPDEAEGSAWAGQHTDGPTGDAFRAQILHDGCGGHEVSPSVWGEGFQKP